MKIEVKTTRECCDTREDLKPVDGSPKVGRFSQYVFCAHCGAHHKYHSYMDAAGSSDWEYRKCIPPWSAA